MKLHRTSFKPINLALIIVVTLFLASCTTHTSTEQTSSVNNQPGFLIQDYLADYAGKSDIEINNALTQLQVQSTKNTKMLISKNKESITSLYKADTLKLVISNSFHSDELSDSFSEIEDLPTSISTLVSLFPIDTYRILSYLGNRNVINKDKLLAIIVENKLDPTIVLKATASGMENSVTPPNSLCRHCDLWPRGR